MNHDVDTLVELINNITEQTAAYREARAAVVAQAIANCIIVDRDTDIPDVLAANRRSIDKVISAVNERMPLDTKLCQELTGQLLKTRYRLVYGVSSFDIAKFILTCREAELETLPEAYRTLGLLEADPDSVAKLVAASNALRGSFEVGD